jgi:hypothetical protein
MVEQKVKVIYFIWVHFLITNLSPYQFVGGGGFLFSPFSFCFLCETKANHPNLVVEDGFQSIPFLSLPSTSTTNLVGTKREGEGER